MAILVTGGTKGIGLAIARRFAKPGTDVFLNYLSDHAAADRAREAVAAAGARAHLLPGDVGTPEGARAVLERVAAVADRLDQLVHCAVRVIPGPLLAIDPADLGHGKDSHHGFTHRSWKGAGGAFTPTPEPERRHCGPHRARTRA